MSNRSGLTWNDRLALINKYEPSDDAICSVFDVTTNELQTARELERAGTFIATQDLDFDSYADLFSSKPRKEGVGAQSFTRTANVAPPATATKKSAEPKKRGRKGSNITTAFEQIPTTPVLASTFAQEYNVSLAVLRQSKRFDKTGGLPVHVKKDKGTKELMIWREVPTTS